jgi:hypothetical protein
MTKYEILINILDTIIKEAPTSLSKKYPIPNSVTKEQIIQPRSRAFIHLFLKVQFGLLDFKKREHFVTDGSYDGGIDGYYINTENKTIYFIQSKFRPNSKNFAFKEIELKEILIMDINRILDGEEMDDVGNEYNGKIKQLQRDISKIDNIGRYSYQVIVLANLYSCKPSELRKLTGGFATIVFDFKKCYEELVFPVLCGTYYQASDLNINIDLSNKNAGSKISYTVQTQKGECEITALFVPTIELGRMMYKYKNSILKYNPRSYLGHQGKKVNNAIRDTILNGKTNEFALFNNGITMLSDETYINERIGQKNKAQLIVINPQIINGGQTCYTLSSIYKENLDNNPEDIFQNKEVLLKVITLLENENEFDKLKLIEDISNATNQQTAVINADRLSNDENQIKLQKFLFDNYGLLYERKRGEFMDGVINGYVFEKDIVERNLFFRIFYASNGEISKAKQKRLFQNSTLSYEEIIDKEKISNTCFGLICHKRFSKESAQMARQKKFHIYAKIRAMTILFKPTEINDYDEAIDQSIKKFNLLWPDCIKASISERNKEEKYSKIRKTTKRVNRWYEDSTDFDHDVMKFYK